MIPVLISSLISLGVYFLGKFIGKRFNFSELSYLGFAIISFILAFICHDKIQNAILNIFVNYPFIDRRTIILLAIALCLIALLFILFIENRRGKAPTNKIDKNKNLKSIIAEIKKNETAITILCSIKTLQDDYQENSEILGRPICIPESEISKHSGDSLGFTQYWIGKLTKAGFLKEGFGEVYGVAQPGLEFLRKEGRLK